jgi:hypothetical protein
VSELGRVWACVWAWPCVGTHPVTPTSRSITLCSCRSGWPPIGQPAAAEGEVVNPVSVAEVEWTPSMHGELTTTVSAAREGGLIQGTRLAGGGDFGRRREVPARPIPCGRGGHPLLPAYGRCVPYSWRPAGLYVSREWRWRDADDRRGLSPCRLHPSAHLGHLAQTRAPQLDGISYTTHNHFYVYN